MKALLAGLLLAALGAGVRAQETPLDYRLGAGDVIRIQVYQNPDLTLETRLSETGTITYPLLGSVTLGGLTVAAAEKSIARALDAGNYIQKPQVTIMVQHMRGNHVSVLGQVNKPGRIALETVNVRVSEILALAGGISTTGADVVLLSGTRDGKPFHREIEVAGMFLDKRQQDDVTVAGGDVLYVHRAPTFYIYGEVNKPGSFRVERAMTMRQALAQAGGPSQRGTERGLLLYRRTPDGRMETRTPDLNDPVQPDDVLYVRESLL